MMNCPACGMVTDPQLGTCVHCGRNLPQKSSPLQRKTQETSDTCPNCGAMVRSSEVICVTCNTNLVTGKVIPMEARINKRHMPAEKRRMVLYTALGVIALAIVGIVVWLAI